MNIRTLTLALSAAALLTTSAQAGFHIFDIQEIYSNADGSVQFIELFSTSSNQEFVSGQTIKLEAASPVSTLATFTFPSNGPTGTLNKTYLIGTSNLTSLYGVTPDFVLPTNFLGVAGGFTNKQLNFASGTDVVNLLNLPLDGVGSLNGLIGNNTPTNTSVNAQATPKNFAGATVTIPEPVSAALLGFGVLALLRRRRVQS